MQLLADSLMREGPDLFGQVRVTWPEIEAWCQRVAGISSEGTRGRAYVRQWDVAGKIARAKEAGQWSDTLAQHAKALEDNIGRNHGHQR